MKQVKDGSLDFGSLLMGLNLIIAGLLVVALIQGQGNEYVNSETFALGIILAIQTHVALFMERKRRDPFVVLLAYTIIVYFSFRILTLSLYPYSTVFERYSFGPNDSNYALMFIIIANVFLYAGFYVVKLRANLAVNPGDWRATSPGRAIILILVGMIFIYSDVTGEVGGGIGRFLGILNLFFNPGLILLMALSYYWLFRKSLSRRFSFALLIIIAVDLGVHTLLSSRGAIVSIVQDSMLVILAVAGCIKLPRRYFAAGIVLLPVAFTLLIGAYAISTINRVNRATEGSLSLAQAFELARGSSASLSNNLNLDTVLPRIFDRVGYFDYSAEIIAHDRRYSPVINVPSYAKSVIDNVLTPGFDLFDQPKTSNALQFVYGGLGRPSKKLVSGNYQSDQIGMYGEYYALFGYASIPFLFFMAFGIKRIYVGLRSANPFYLTIKRLFVLVVFWKIIISYGIDWIIMDIVPMVAAIFIYSFFFRSKPVSDARKVGNSPTLSSPSMMPV